MRKRSKLIAEMNMVPFIDVMLVLLVIFMITTPLLSQGVNVDLPQAGGKPMASQAAPIIVSVDKQGRYFLNVAAQTDVPLSPEALTQQVMSALKTSKAKNQTRSVLVKGDKTVDYCRVVQAMVLLQQAGVDRVGLMTEEKR